jgi:hypothetical protein
VDGILVGPLRVGDRRPGGFENVARDGAHSRTDCSARLQGGFVNHLSF